MTHKAAAEIVDKNFSCSTVSLQLNQAVSAESQGYQNIQLMGTIVVYHKCSEQPHCSQNVITLFKSCDFLGNRPTLGKNKHCEKVLLSKSIFHKMCDDDSDGNDKYDYFMMIVMIKNRKIT